MASLHDRGSLALLLPVPPLLLLVPMPAASSAWAACVPPRAHCCYSVLVVVRLRLRLRHRHLSCEEESAAFFAGRCLLLERQLQRPPLQLIRGVVLRERQLLRHHRCSSEGPVADSCRG